MRFVAGRGAKEVLLAEAPWRRRWQGAPWWKAIGKMLLAGAPWWLSYCWPGDATEQDAAGRGAVVESHREDVAGRGAVVAKLLLAWGRH